MSLGLSLSPSVSLCLSVTLSLSLPGLVSLYLKQLDSDAGEHELQQRGDDHDVTDGTDGHEHTLDHMLQADNTP